MALINLVPFLTRFTSCIARNISNRGLSSSVSVKILMNSDHDVSYKHLAVTTPVPFVFHVELNRPKIYNALCKEMWIEIKNCFNSLTTNPDCRVVVLSAAGKHFSAGIDLMDMMQLGQELNEINDVARKGAALEKLIKLYQDAITSLEVCPKPVITAIHSGCIGAGVNLITAADIRLCSEDAFFQIKEVELGMAADVGVLQRFPKAVGNQSLARELCFTGRRFDSQEANNCGLVSRVYTTKDELLKGSIELAKSIAAKSPIAIQATKINVVYSQSRPNQEGLDQIREMNKLNLQSEDFVNAAGAQMSKGEKPTFAKL